MPLALERYGQQIFIVTNESIVFSKEPCLPGTTLQENYKDSCPLYTTGKYFVH